MRVQGWRKACSRSLIWSLIACFAPPGTVNASISAMSVPKQINMRYAQLPLSFVRNIGQIEGPVQYYERAESHATFFSPDAVHFRFTGTRSRTRGDVLTLRFLGQRSNDARRLTARNPLEGHVNYIMGQDPKRWLYDIPMFKEVIYEQAFPGTDIHFYGNQRQLEYDIILSPGTNPNTVRFAYEGANNLRLNAAGDLEIVLDGGTIIQNRPTIFQEIDGVRHAVSGAFELFAENHPSKRTTHAYGFKLGNYDPKYPVVIDPILVYSTYLGGTHHDHAHGIAVDSAGNTYIAGETRSLTFPIAAPIQAAMAGDEDAFVTKLNASGTGVLYSTYLGGQNHDEAYGISVDASGNAYVSGYTRSSTFPVSASAFQQSLSRNDDAFLIALDPSGALMYSTYLGGTRSDKSFTNANDGTGMVYLGGTTSSSNFPTVSAYQPTSGGDSDAFVAKIDTTKFGAASLVYSTYLGGKKDEEGNGIAVNTLGEVFISGTTESKSTGGTPFPVTAGAYQSSLNGEEDAFLTRLSAAGNSLIYSSYLGGDKDEKGWGVALNGTSTAYITGASESKSGVGAFPTTVGALQSTRAGEEDAFLSEIDTSIGGSLGLIYSTYIGGSNKDVGYAVAVDGAGRAHVTGYSKVTNQTLFPVTVDAIQSTYGGNEDAFYLILDPAQSGTAGLVFSTYLGGKKYDKGRGIVLDSAGNAYITGKTRSDGTQSFPTTSGSFQSFSAGNDDAFIAKIGIATNAPPVIGADPALTISGGGAVTSGNVLANDTDPEGNPLSVIALDTATANGGTVVYNNNGTFTYTAAAGFAGIDTFTYTVSDGAGGTVVVTQSVTVNGLPVIGADPALSAAGTGAVTSGNVLANDTDPEGNPLSIAAFDAATINGGTVSYNAVTGQFTYMAAVGFFGVDTFTYTVSDGAGGTVVVTQSVTVNGLPVIGVDPVLTVSGGGTVISGNVLANDIDPEGSPLSIIFFDATTAIGGTVVYNNNGTFTYTAAAGFAGIDTFTYTVSDGAGGTIVATQSVTVSSTCSGSSVLTPTGAAVNVTPSAGIDVQYAGVSSSGTTCLTNPGPITPAPNGFGFGVPADVFSLSTTAITTGSTRICLVFDPANYNRVAGIRLMSYQAGTWVDITSSLDTATNTICGLSGSTIGTYALTEELPTAISLRSFKVARSENGVDIRWVTTSETDNWGFRILRSLAPEGPFKPLNDSLIPALGGPGLDMTYHFQDYSAPTGTTYYYRLQDVDTRGLVSEHSVVALLDNATSGKVLVANNKQTEAATTIATAGGGSVQIVSYITAQESPAVALIVPAAESQAMGEGTVEALSAAADHVYRVQGHTLGAQRSTRREPSVPIDQGRPLSFGELTQARAELAAPRSDIGVPDDIKSAFDFEVDIADAKGNHIIVSREATGSTTSDLKVTRAQSGAYRLDWQVRDRKVQGFSVYRRALENSGSAAGYEKIVRFIPNYGQGDDEGYHYTFTDHSADAKTAYEYELRVLEWGLGFRGDRNTQAMGRTAKL